MAFEINGKVGVGVAADGSLVDPRMTRDLGTVVGDGHARYYENASRGLTFIASTAAAGIAHGSALTATGALMLVNPVGSGRNLSIIRLTFAPVSGTLGVATMWWTQGANPAVLPSETSAATRVSSFLNGSSAGDVAKAYSGVSLTTVPTIVRPTPITFGPIVVGTQQATTFQPPQYEEVAGALVVSPGFFVAVEGIGTAGTTPLVVMSIEYEVVSQ